MIGVLTQYPLSPELTIHEIEQIYEQAAPKLLHMPGLIRKYFFVQENGRAATGVYLWEARAAAEAFFTPEWMDFMTAKYGARPKVTYFHCPVVVDNASGEIEVDRRG